MGTEPDVPNAPVDLLERLLERVSMAMLAIDAERRVIFFNEEAEMVTGLSRSQILGSELARFTGEGANPVMKALGDVMERALNWSEDLHLQTVGVHSDGRYRMIGYNATPLLYDDGSLQGAILVFNDVTEIERIAHARSESDSLSMLSKAMSWMGHQVKTSLATIQMYAGLSARKAGPEAQESLSVIREQVALAQNRISQALRVFAPVVEGPQLQVCDLASVLETFVAEQEPTLPHATVRVRSLPEPCFVPLLETDVALILSNLFCNAAEAVGERGNIDIRLEASGSRVLLVIEDDGPGFAAGDPQRFLQPFFSLKPRSTGLGLWMVERLVLTVKGRVLLENRAEGGARVTLDLPCLDTCILKSRPILVAESDEGLREAIAAHLAALGALVTTARNGDEAMKALDREMPSLVVAHYSLPGLDAPRAVSRLHPSVPVLVITNQDQPHLRLNQPRPKRLAFIPKPFELQDLTLALCYLVWEAEA